MESNKEINILKESKRLLQSDYAEAVDTIAFLNKKYHVEARKGIQLKVSEDETYKLFMGSLAVNLILVIGIVVVLFIL